MFVEVDSPLNTSFPIKTSFNQLIIEIKETIQNKIGYRCDEQWLELLSHEDHNVRIKLQDGKKLGDYTAAICGKCKLIVTKQAGNDDFKFTSRPNVTHYEYARMSSHVYQPNKPFLDGWNVTTYNPSNKYDLALAFYVNAQRHQCVISVRGTVLTSGISGILNNIITDLRLFLSNHSIDIFDSVSLRVFHGTPIAIPHSDAISYDVSFTGHSLGAALAESLACAVQGYAVTFDSPGTSKILNNDPYCQENIKKGYKPKRHIVTYLGTYANVINAANPQFGKIIYLKQFGISNGTSQDKFYYIDSSAACIYFAACMFASIADRNVFKLALWFSIGYFIKQSKIASKIQKIFDPNGKNSNIFGSYSENLPFLFMVFLLCHSVFTLAGVIERYMSQLSNILTLGLDRFPLMIKRILNWIVAFTRRYIDFDGVFADSLHYVRFLQFHSLSSSFFPCLHYLYWLKSAHSIDKFVESFNPNTGKPYKGRSIESNLWPTLSDHLMEKPSNKFLLFILIIQSMKPIAFHLVLPYVPRCVRLNIILFLFAWGFNIDAIKHLLMLFFSIFGLFRIRSPYTKSAL